MLYLIQSSKLHLDVFPKNLQKTLQNGAQMDHFSMTFRVWEPLGNRFEKSSKTIGFYCIFCLCAFSACDKQPRTAGEATTEKLTQKHIEKRAEATHQTSKNAHENAPKSDQQTRSKRYNFQASRPTASEIAPGRAKNTPGSAAKAIPRGLQRAPGPPRGTPKCSKTQQHELDSWASEGSG